MINKEIILNADGSIKKDFSDRAIPQNSNNQVSVNVLIPSTCFVGLQNYAVLLAVSRIIGNSETTLNTLVMSVSKSITIEGVVYVKYTAYLSSDYTDKLGQLKFSPYIQTTATTTVDDESVEVISIQQAFTNSNLNVIKSVLPQYDASLEEGTIATTLETQINGKKIYTFIDDATSLGEHYYNLVDGFNPGVDQFKGCLVVSVYNGATTYIMPYLYNDDIELLEITKDGKLYKISNVSMDELGDTTYIYDRTQLSYSKTEIDTKESAIYDALALKVDKTQKVNGHALSGDITLTKGDVGLGNVVNYGVETTPTITGDNLYITSKGVYDALQVIYGIISGLATDDDITTINNRLNSIETIIGSDDGDADSVINTLKEVIVVLNGLGEGANLLDLINAKANQSDFTALNSEINGENGIKDKVDLLSERNNAYMEIKNSLGTIDILTSDWEANTGDTEYPYKWELENGYLEGAVNCIVVYSKDSDTSMLSATTGIDEVNGKLVIYASELPSDTISIEKIAVFNDLNAYINYSNEIVQQVLANTDAISDINNTKLPQYVKKEIIRNNFRTFVNNKNYAENGSQIVDVSLQAVEVQNANTFTNCNVTATLTGAMLRTIKVENGSVEQHTLLLDVDGNLTLDGNAVGGGGSQLYQHIIGIMQGTDTLGWFEITCDKSTQLTFSEILSWLGSNGYVITTNSVVKSKLYPKCYGVVNYGGTNYALGGICKYDTYLSICVRGLSSGNVNYSPHNIAESNWNPVVYTIIPL